MARNPCWQPFRLQLTRANHRPNGPQLPSLESHRQRDRLTRWEQVHLDPSAGEQFLALNRVLHPEKIINLYYENTSYKQLIKKHKIRLYNLGAIHKLRHTSFMVFLTLPRPWYRWSHFWDRPPPTLCDITYFAILHLEIIKIKQQFRNYFYFHLNYFSIKSTSDQTKVWKWTKH